MTAAIERELTETFRAATGRTVESDDLYERVARAIADRDERRRRNLHIGVGVIAALGATGALILSTLQEGSLHMRWYILELIANLVLLATAVGLGPPHQTLRQELRRRCIPGESTNGQELPRPHRCGLLPDLLGVPHVHDELRTRLRLDSQRGRRIDQDRGEPARWHPVDHRPTARRQHHFPARHRSPFDHEQTARRLYRWTARSRTAPECRSGHCSRWRSVHIAHRACTRLASHRGPDEDEGS